jgi:hypothetical protein
MKLASGAEQEDMHCSSAIGPIRIELRWGCEESSEKTAVGSGVSFKYDPFGRRIYKSSSSGTSVYAYDGSDIAEETNSSGSVVARYAQGENIDEPLAVLRAGTTSYYHADGLGSITSLSNTAGALVQTYGYDSFGKQLSSTGSLTNPFQYTGREFDAETSLYFNRARYLRPCRRSAPRRGSARFWRGWGQFLRLRWQQSDGFYRSLWSQHGRCQVRTLRNLKSSAARVGSSSKNSPILLELASMRFHVSGELVHSHKLHFDHTGRL